MSIIIKKGQRISLDQKSYDLSRVTIGLGWKVHKPRKGVWEILKGGISKDIDLDAIAFVLDENGHIRNLGVQRDMGGGRLEGFYRSDVVFYNNLEHPSGAIWHTGDERKGHLSEDDDEQIVVRLNEVSDEYHRIRFLVTIYKGEQREQDFGMLSQAYIHALDARNQVIARYDLTDADKYAGNYSLVFAEVVRGENGWEFQAVGKPYPTDRFVDILREHLPPEK